MTQPPKSIRTLNNLICLGIAIIISNLITFFLTAYIIHLQSGSKLTEIREVLQMCEHSVPYDPQREAQLIAEKCGDHNEFLNQDEMLEELDKDSP